jgi:two-component sensor histidine kinase
MIVEDVRESYIFDGQPLKELLLDAGVYAVTSIPLTATGGNLLGMVSMYFAKPHHPSERELRLLDLLVRQTVDYLERKQSRETEKILLNEIEHRSNNLLAVIQTIAKRSLSGDYTLAQAREGFEARLQALARANRQLTKSNWSGLKLGELVRLELQPFAERTLMDGTEVMLPPRIAQNFSLAVHELATNAAKYGAFSNGSGKVEVCWTTGRGGKNNRLKFKWKERGGPPLVVPTRYGFGTTLIKTTFPNATVDYAVDGLSCEIDVPLSHAEHHQIEALSGVNGEGREKPLASVCVN